VAANWKKNDSSPEECVPKTTSEGIAFMVLGIIGICGVYLLEDCSRIVLNPREFCELAFSCLKARHVRMSVMSGNQGIGHACGMLYLVSMAKQQQRIQQS
jgi:hypothetical protein